MAYEWAWNLSEGVGLSKISILHLSDAHWCAHNAHYQRQIVNALCKDLALLKNERGIAPECIVFSGDLVIAGENRPDFDSAYEAILDPIKDVLGISSENIIICPGNHDINRKNVREIDALEAGLRSKLISEEAVNAFSRNALDEDMQALLAVQRMENFDDFIAKRITPDEKFGTFAKIYRRNFGDHSIAFVAINSAWRSSGEADGRDDRNLLLGTQVIEEIEGFLEGTDLRIAVFHHPLEYHAPFERVLTEGRLARSFDVVCNGHTHLPAPQGVSTMHGSCILSQVGSLYAGTKWHNGYQILEIDIQSEKANVYSREYSRVLDKFSAATNLIEADPLTLDFKKKGGGSEHQISVFLNGNQEEISSQFAEHIDFSSDGGLTDAQLISRYEPPPLFRKSNKEIDESSNIVPKYEKIEFNSLLVGDENIFFYGSRQSGKTSLKHHISYIYSHGKGVKQKIPINLDSKTFRFNLYDLGRNLRSQYQVSKDFNLEEHIQLGSFVFLFDNCCNTSDENLEKIKKFSQNFSPCRTFVFATPNEATFSKERHFHRVLNDFDAIGIGELRRGAIRRMARSWFQTDTDANQAFELVMAQIARDGLPKTAYIAGLLLWAAKKGQGGDRLNEAILLQNLLDHLLSRADFRRAKRGTFTTRGRELLLGEIANYLSEMEDSARYSDVVALVERYFLRKQLKHDPGEVVDELIGCGILARNDGLVSFRFLCFQEFYIALSMTGNAERDRKINGAKFLDYRREVELLAGIMGENDDLINHIMSVLDEKMPQDLGGVAYSDFEEEVYKIRQSFVTRDKVKKIRKTRLSEDQIDQVMDALDDRATSKGDRPMSESLKEAKGDFAKAAEARQIDAIAADLSSDAKHFRPGTFMAGLSLLSRVLRNSDYTDYDIKANAIETIFDRWCRIHILMLGEVRWILKKMEEKEAHKLSEKDFELLVSMVSKILFGTTASALVEDLSTPSLGKTIVQLSEDDRLIGGKALLGDIVLEDCDEEGWDARWNEKILDKRTSAFDIDVMTDRLWRSVNRKALDEDQDKRVELVLDAVEKRFKWHSNHRSSVVQDIRGIRDRKRLEER